MDTKTRSAILDLASVCLAQQDLLQKLTMSLNAKGMASEEIVAANKKAMETFNAFLLGMKSGD